MKTILPIVSLPEASLMSLEKEWDCKSDSFNPGFKNTK